jgi:hypothetical protein
VSDTLRGYRLGVPRGDDDMFGLGDLSGPPFDGLSAVVGQSFSTAGAVENLAAVVEDLGDAASVAILHGLLGVALDKRIGESVVAQREELLDDGLL